MLQNNCLRCPGGQTGRFSSGRPDPSASRPTALPSRCPAVRRFAPTRPWYVGFLDSTDPSEAMPCHVKMPPKDFKRGGLNQTPKPFRTGRVETWNPKEFQIWFKEGFNPILNSSWNQPWNPFGFQTEWFKPNLKPFRVSNGEGVKPNPKPFRVSNREV